MTSSEEAELQRLRAELDMAHERLRLQDDLLQSRAHIERMLAIERFELASGEAESIDDFPVPREEERVRADFGWNLHADTAFANVHSGFDSVCHIAHADWFGIRAAMGSLPGNKLVIPSMRRLAADEISHVLSQLELASINRIVLHGMSEGMHDLAARLRRKGWDSQYLVWHGTTTQWANFDEKELALRAIRMAKKGEVRRFSAIRRGLHEVVGDRDYRPQLLNLPPRWESTLINGFRPHGQRIALAPSWNDLRKNLATNVLAAEFSPWISETRVIAESFALPRWLSSKLKRQRKLDYRSMISTMSASDIVLNVTTIDCHPMVDLEALSGGTPCIRGPLFLDGLDDHPYIQLTAVANPMSVEDVTQRINEVMQMESNELLECMTDYGARLKALAFSRYADFLEL